ncbi:MAG: hypothetical protein U9N86_02595 [Bacteroidota bacterium]|nr:hypothetical protein [Bacteroidota bacterium]
MKNILIIIYTGILMLFPMEGQAQEIKGLYVNSSDEILGDSDQESLLLDYIIQGNFNSITFYSFHRLDFSQSEVRENLRNFIRLGKSKYGLTRIGAASESLNGFINNIHLFNLDTLTLPDDRIDHYNLEFEFWSNSATAGYYCTKYLEPNGYSCNPNGAFSYVSQLLKDLRSQISNFPEIEIEVYVGWIDEDHAASLIPLADRILYAVYRNMEADGSIELYDFGQQRKRLTSLGQNGEISIIPIFSSYDGSTDPSLNTWLRKGHSPCEAWEQYASSFNRDIMLKNRKQLNLDGYQWFKYSSMPNLPMVLRAPDPIMGPTTVKVRETVRYLIPQVKDALRFEWQIYPNGAKHYHSAHETEMLIQFPRAGSATLMVRALGCGAISPFARIQIQVEENFPVAEPISLKQSSGFNIIVKHKALHINISREMKGPFHIQAINSLGRKILTKTITFPGDYCLPLYPISDSIHFVQVSISHQEGSFCKKFSILDL